MRIAALLLALPIAACVQTGSTERLTLEYQVGEELMNDCNIRKQRCPEWLAFKKEFEEGVSYLTTFERSLAAHKARVAAGGGV